MKLFKLNIADLTDSKIQAVKDKFPLRYQIALSLDNKEDFLMSIAGTYLISIAYPELSEEKLYYGKFGHTFSPFGEMNITHSNGIVLLTKDDSPIGIRVYFSNELEKEALFVSLSKFLGYGKHVFENVQLKSELESIANVLFVEKQNLINGLTTHYKKISFSNFSLCICSYKEFKDDIEVVEL